jgi:hypothetical protein
MNNQAEMRRIVAGLPTKSEKIRRLGQAGYRRQEIADFLGLRYQHVRNVLVDAEKKRTDAFAEPKPSWRAGPSEDFASDEAGKIRIRNDGAAIIPSSLVVHAGFQPGDNIVVHVAAQGDLRLLSGPAALRRAQEMVREIVPADADLLAELFKDRRQQVERERRLAGDE